MRPIAILPDGRLVHQSGGKTLIAEQCRMDPHDEHLLAVGAVKQGGQFPERFPWEVRRLKGMCIC